MTRRIRYSQKKPVGWRNESYRHYLAAKGIRTSQKRYFVRNFLKGNRESGMIKSLYAQGYTKEEAYRILGIPLPKKKSEALLDVPDRDELLAMQGRVLEQPVAQEQMPVVQEPMPVIEEPVVPARQVQPVVSETAQVREEVAGQEIKDEHIPGSVEMTPGVPPPPPSGFNIL